MTQVDDEELVFDVNHLSKTFGGKTAVYDFSIQAKPGEIVGFYGPNGSGKTTVIRMLCGLLVPDGGGGQVLGYNLATQANEIRTHVGYMTQNFTLYKHLTVYENLDFFAKLYKIENKTQKIQEVIDQMALNKYRNTLAGNLSGGWKQLLSLGAVLLYNPKILLLDEPTAGVDPDARRDFWDVITEIAAEGVTVLLSSHYIDEAERCQRIIYLVYGKEIAQGTTHQIIQQANLYAWQVSGRDLYKLLKKLEELDAIQLVTVFGNYLHVIGQNKNRMLKSLRPYQLDLRYRWKGIMPTLEEVFTFLASQNKDERFA